MLGAGLEPASLSAYAPQTYVSASSTTRASVGEAVGFPWIVTVNGKWGRAARKRFVGSCQRVDTEMLDVCLAELFGFHPVSRIDDKASKFEHGARA